MTNEALGQKIGVSPSMASRIRNGQRLPGTATMDRIHRELGIPLEELHGAYRRGDRAFGELMRGRLETLKV